MNIDKSKEDTTYSLIPFLSITFVFIALSILNVPIMETLWRHSFDDGTYSHAFLIPFIALYLFFELSRNGKLIFREKLSALSIILLIGSGTLLFVTSNAQISLGYWLSLLALATSSLIVLFNFSWIIIFPVAFLAFIFPFWGLLIPFLQNLSIAAVTFIMSFTGIPTYVNAEFITIPSGVFEIADGCSGLRYFIVSIAISSLFIFLYIKSLKRALLFFSVAILGALLTNWIRITALIVIGDYTNMESSLMEDHNAFGWYIYIPFMLLLFKWGNTLIDTDIFHNSNETTKSTTPTLSVLLITSIVILLSSTTLKSNLASTNNEKTLAASQIQAIFPEVYYYSSIEQKKLTQPNDLYQLYKFDGSNLDGKPSYYANTMVPENHKLIRSEIRDGWNAYFTQYHANESVILFRYELDNTTYTNLGKLKVARLKKAFSNINNSSLQWAYLHCENNCEKAISSFLTIDINNF